MPRVVGGRAVSGFWIVPGPKWRTCEPARRQSGARTRSDLSFRLGDIPVRVHPYFWLTTALLGLNTRLSGIDILIYLLIWTAIVFVSISVHELGHVLMGRYLGSRGHIILTGMCGLAVGSSNLPRRGQRIAVLLAGPGAGILLAALIAGLFWLYNPA